MKRSGVVRSLVAAIAVALLATATPREARAQAPALINGFGGAAGYGTACLSPNDDGSSASIPITAAFPSGLHFFSGTYNNMYVNTNGNITFSGAVPTYTPNAFPVANQPMIAPYWADVDIRPNGCGGLGGGTSSSGSLACQNPSQNGVWWHLEPGRIVVTWDRVGYFNCHVGTTRMNFQLVLTAAPDCVGGGDFDVEFRYNRCEWETGDASGGSGGFGGTQAQAGFDAGDRTNYVAIPGSRMAGIARNLCMNSNVSMPGIWRFQIRGGTVMCPNAGMACNTGMQGICGEGRQQCVGSGTQCVGTTTAQPSACNGLDNDCDGTVDTGPCPAGQVCDGAQCRDRCVEGGCNPGQSCNAAGLCIDDACASVNCPAGQRCVGGSCVGACDGVTCPLGQVCRNGGCVDPCNGLTCDAQQVCEDGACVARCPCRACTAGHTCAMDGHCVESGCETMSCGAGQVCRGGACMDACTGAVCPAGQICQAGACIMDPNAVDAGTGDDSSVPVGDVVIGQNDAGADLDGSSMTGGDARADARRGDGGTGTQDATCACRTVGGSSSRVPSRGVFAMLAIAGAMVVRRRRRDRQS